MELSRICLNANALCMCVCVCVWVRELEEFKLGEEGVQTSEKSRMNFISARALLELILFYAKWQNSFECVSRRIVISMSF